MPRPCAESATGRILENMGLRPGAPDLLLSFVSFVSFVSKNPLASGTREPDAKSRRSDWVQPLDASLRLNTAEPCEGYPR